MTDQEENIHPAKTVSDDDSNKKESRGLWDNPVPDSDCLSVPIFLSIC